MDPLCLLNFKVEIIRALEDDACNLTFATLTLGEEGTKHECVLGCAPALLVPLS